MPLCIRAESEYLDVVDLRVVSLFLSFILVAVSRGQDPALPTANAEAAPAAPSMLEAQVELHRRGFSCGAIDGVYGPQTAAALRAFQRGRGITETGNLDPETGERLRPTIAALGEHTFTAAELGSLQAVATTWLDKSEQSALGFATGLELVSERYHSSQNLLRRLNPAVDWGAVLPGTRIVVPAADHVTIAGTATRAIIRLADRELELFDAESRVIAHFPVSIARMAEKRPVGELEVIVAARDPNYTFDPDVFPESPEARELGRKLIIPPGPNNPVGRAWIGLNRSGYGIHGTPDPEKIGRTESHGCFRLANWDAVTLLDRIYVGMPVVVEP